ncbi:hypothetical protein K402DRAFT_462874 [Aulographum hederae CBS 113979]|uniref:polynucleotide adenylyltransferase n=1 Tax=Aulographum hederae CBS 113979 TaxID=1176131 RepID=A0A6G1H1R7_9PEZI|nr:hypothetical protein K402DRAFT_462874 [Aulographum hederae CBS 113979]
MAPNNKKSKSDETVALESQIRNLILGNVRIEEPPQRGGAYNARPPPPQTQNAPLNAPLNGDFNNQAPSVNRPPQNYRAPPQQYSAGPPHTLSYNTNTHARLVPQQPHQFAAAPASNFRHRGNPSGQRQLYQPEPFYRRGNAPGVSGTPNNARGNVSMNQPHTQEWFGEQCAYLDRLAAVEIPKVQMTSAELAEKEAFRAALETICQVALETEYPKTSATIHLKCFGSISSGFATVGSDVDLAIVLSESVYHADESSCTNASVAQETVPPLEISRVLEKAILGRGHGARLLSKTRVPIIKVCEKPLPGLYTALCQERQRWEDLPGPEKYDTPATPMHNEVNKKAVSASSNAASPATPSTVPTPNQVNEEAEPALSDDVSPAVPSAATSSCAVEPVVPMQSTVNKPSEDTTKSVESDPATTRTTCVNRLIGELATIDSMCQNHGAHGNFAGDFATRIAQMRQDVGILAQNLIPNAPGNVSTNDITRKNIENLSSTLSRAERERSIDHFGVQLASKILTSLQRFCHSLDKRDHSSSQNQADDQRKPVSRAWTREKELGPLDFPKSGVGIQADINFSNPLALHNTLLLRCYSLCDPRVRQVVLFMKSWAKQRKINSSRFGTLSSYGYVLMVLHFLVNVCKPPVLPNLQSPQMIANQGPWTSKPPQNMLVEGYDVRFWRDEEAIKRLIASGQGSQNREPIGVLLRNFFAYYSSQGGMIPGGGFNWTRDVLSLRSAEGLLSKNHKGWTGAKNTVVDNREVRQRYLFAIEDPFELEHNVARTVTHFGIVAIRDEFRRAWRILGDVGRGQQPVDGALFAEVVEGNQSDVKHDTTVSVKRDTQYTADGWNVLPPSSDCGSTASAAASAAPP